MVALNDAESLGKSWTTLWSGLNVSAFIANCNGTATEEEVHEVLRYIFVVAFAGEQEPGMRTMRLNSRLNAVRIHEKEKRGRPSGLEREG